MNRLVTKDWILGKLSISEKYNKKRVAYMEDQAGRVREVGREAESDVWCKLSD